MKAVIFAAGKGVRMRPLTLDTPKPLIKVNGKPILEHILESLPEEIDEVLITIRYLGEKIKNHLGSSWQNKKIKYVKEEDKSKPDSYHGSATHLKDERFLLIYGDEITNPVDIRNCLKKDLSLLTFKPKNPSACGMVYLRKNGTIKKIIEKPKTTKSKIAANGVIVLNTDIFKYKPLLVHGEYYFSTMLAQFIQDNNVFPVKAKDFIGDFTTPADIPRVEKLLKTRYLQQTNA